MTMGESMTITLPYLKDFRDRHGRRRVYFRRKGFKATALPDPGPGPAPSDEFMAAYRACLEQGPAAPRASHKPGTFGAVIVDYYGSAEFKNLKASSQAQARRVLDKLRKEHGHKPLARLERKHVRRMRDELADKPGAAMNLLKWLRRVLAFALENGHVVANPAARLQGFKLGEWRAWTDAELDAFRARWPAGTMERRAFTLALYTGQRCADLAAMTKADRKDGCIDVAQEKTGEKLSIPEHRDLKAELENFASKHMMLLHNTRGKPFRAAYLSQ